VVTSRERRMTERGDVVQWMKVEPSERTTRCGNWGTTGLGKVFGRRFHTCVRPYGDEETERVWRKTKELTVDMFCAFESEREIRRVDESDMAGEKTADSVV